MTARIPRPPAHTARTQREPTLKGRNGGVATLAQGQLTRQPAKVPA